MKTNEYLFAREKCSQLYQNAMTRETKRKTVIAVRLFIRVKIVRLKYRDRATHTQPISVKNYVLHFICYVTLHYLTLSFVSFGFNRMRT